MGLTKAQSEFFAENGYLVVENLVSPENLARLRTQVDEVQNTILEAQASAKARQSGVAYIVEPGSNGGGTTVPGTSGTSGTVMIRVSSWPPLS